MKYTRKQIAEAVKQWKTVLESIEAFKKIDDIVTYLESKKLNWIRVKKFQRIKALQSKGGEEIKTVGSDGNEETIRTTKNGDWVVNNVSNGQNKWIIDDNTFKKKYEKVSMDIYKPKGGPMLAAKVSDCEEDGVEFAPPNWGGDVIKIKNDGYFMKDPTNNKDIYAISKEDFDSTYKPESQVHEDKIKTYTKHQISEAIKYWKNELKQLNESEDIVDGDNGILRCSARDMIFEDSECLGQEVEAEELQFGQFGIRDRLPVIPTREETDAIKKLQTANSNGYRVIAYIYKGRTIDNAEWTEANDNISDQDDYNQYVDPNSEYNAKWPDEYDAKFAQTFKTYESWKKYNEEIAVKNFKHLLESSGKITYEYAAKSINIDQNGNVYTLIVWRP